MPSKISVIVPVFNAASTIKKCLDTLLCQQASFPFEVLVVNDGSTDGTMDILQKYSARVKVLSQDNAGPAAARNRGAMAAEGDILVFCDSDCSFEKDFIEEMAMPIIRGGDKNIVGVQGRYKTLQRPVIARFCQEEIDERYSIFRKNEYIFMIGTYAAAYKKSAFLDIGMFDTSFPIASGEDADLSFKMGEKGCRLVFNEKAVCYHRHPETIGSYYRQKFGRAYWRNLLYKVHPRRIVDDSYTPQVLKAQTAMSLVFYIMALLLIASIFLNRFFGAVLTALCILIVGYLFSTIPLIVHVAGRDRGIVWLVPFCSFVRSFALVNGLVAGFIGIHMNSAYKKLLKKEPDLI